MDTDKWEPAYNEPCVIPFIYCPTEAFISLYKDFFFKEMRKVKILNVHIQEAYKLK